MEGCIDVCERVLFPWSEQKVVSLFETHTDIIVKGRRDVVFGHKVALTTGKSFLILDCRVLRGNPADQTLVADIIERHVDSYGHAPRQMAFDGGFATINNRDLAKRRGVIDVMFSKTRGMALTSLATSKKCFKLLARFRAGIEACISALKRSFGFNRVLAKGWDGFKAAIQCSVVTFNLTVLARQTTRPKRT